MLILAGELLINTHLVFLACLFLKLNRVIVAVIVFLFSSACGATGEEQYAPIVAKAQQSLLLDATMVDDNILVVGERGHILRSTDEGESWQQMRVPTRQMLTAIFFVNADTGWVVGHDGLILKTVDGGINWEVQRDGLVNQTHINAEAVETAREHLLQLKRQPKLASQPDLNNQIEEAELDLEDALLTFKEPVFTSPLFDVWFRTPLEGWAVGAYGLALHTLDGGVHWQAINDRMPNSDEMHLNAVVGTSDGSLWVVGEAGMVMFSADEGQHWHKQEFPYSGSLFGIVANSDASTVLAFGLRGNCLLTMDKGLSWEPVPIPNELTLFGGTIEGQHVVLVGNAGLVVEGNIHGGAFKVTTRSNRLAMSAVVVLNKQHFIAVGDKGIQHIGQPSKVSLPH